MSQDIDAQYLPESALEQFGLLPNEEIIAEAYVKWWELKKAKAFTSTKLSTYPDVNKIWNDPEYAPLQSQFEGRNIELKENLLHSELGQLSGVKWVHSNSANRALGKPRSRSTMTIRDGVKGNVLFNHDGSQLSAARTTFVPLKTFELRYVQQANSDAIYEATLFLYGSGPVNEWYIKMLAYLFAKYVDKIYICTTPKSGEPPSGQRLIDVLKPYFAKKYGEQPFEMEAVVSNDQQPETDMTVTATDAYKMIVDMNKLAPDATTVALSGHEFSIAYIRDINDRKGHMAAEDVLACFKRNAQGLSSYYQTLEPTLEAQVQRARNDGVMDLADVTPKDLDLEKPMHVTGVGEPTQDLVCSAYLAMLYYQKIGSTKHEQIFKTSLRIA